MFRCDPGVRLLGLLALTKLKSGHPVSSFPLVTGNFPVFRYFYSKPVEAKRFCRGGPTAFSSKMDISEIENRTDSIDRTIWTEYNRTV